MKKDIKDMGIIAAITAKSQEEAWGYIDACVKGGIKGVELNNNIPNICEFAKKVRNKYPNLLIGVAEIIFTEGTNDLEGVCDYIATAYFNESMHLICSEQEKLTYVPCAVTVTEIRRVYDYGYSLFKLYPAQLANPDYARVVKSVIRHIKMIVAGDINIDNIEDWLKNGCDCVVVGRYLIESKNLEEVEHRAKKLVKKLTEFKLRNSSNF